METHDDSNKRRVPLEDVYSGSSVETCPASILLFPRIVDWRESYLEPFSKPHAFQELLPECPSLSHPSVSKRHFDTLAQLVRNCACYRLHLGEDVAQIAELVAPLLK